MTNAAKMIQKNFRRWIKQSKFQLMNFKLNRAAKKIQSQWKVHRKRQFQFKILNHVKIKSTINIQKLLKGFRISKKFEHVYVKMRLTDNMTFFDNFKGNLQEDAQVKIAYHWRKKLKRNRDKKSAFFVK